MATSKKTTGISNAEKMGIGATLTAAAVAAAGAYFLYGSKSAAKNRKTVKSWALKAKAEVLEQLENAKEMSQDEYEQLIDGVSKMYSEVKKVSKGEVSDFKKEMKDNWKAIAKNVVKKAVTAKSIPKKTKAAPKKTMTVKATTTTTKKVTVPKVEAKVSK